MRVLVTLAALSVVISAAPAGADDWTPGYYMAQSLDTCFDAADRFLGETEYGYCPQISLVGTYMHEGETYPLLKNFDPNQNYVIIAAGDEDATDVDIHLYNPRGELVVEDVETSPLAIVEFNANRGGEFSIEVELYEAEEPSFVSFVILEEGGWYIPRREFDIAKGTMFEMCKGANEGAQSEGAYVQFNDIAGQATLFGGLLGGEEGTQLTNLNLGDSEVLIVGAGDSDVQDIDLVLYDSVGTEIDADRLEDAHPVIAASTYSDELYTVDITSWATQDSVPTYCIVGVLLVRPQ